MDGASREAGITELILSATPRVGHYIEKTLAKMHPTPLPYWHEYQWDPQDTITDPDYVIQPSGVLDITGNMSPDGTLNWEARSEEHTSELQSLMRTSYAVFCLKKKKTTENQ